MKPWTMWATGSALGLIATVIALLNFVAAADVGYDRYPGGGTIIARWGYALAGFFVVGLVCGGMAIRARWWSR
jgi:hypothetical protein